MLTRLNILQGPDIEIDTINCNSTGTDVRRTPEIRSVTLMFLLEGSETNLITTIF